MRIFDIRSFYLPRFAVVVSFFSERPKNGWKQSNWMPKWLECFELNTHIHVVCEYVKRLNWIWDWLEWNSGVVWLSWIVEKLRLNHPYWSEISRVNWGNSLNCLMAAIQHQQKTSTEYWIYHIIWLMLKIKVQQNRHTHSN